MKNNIYINAKQIIKQEAKQLKRNNTDKPYIREVLNNLCDQLSSEFSWYAMKGKISEKQAFLYSLWLSSFTADMHP